MSQPNPTAERAEARLEHQSKCDCPCHKPDLQAIWGFCAGCMEAFDEECERHKDY